MRKSQQTSLIATFAALHAILYFLSFGLWRNWGIYLSPIEAVVLGPSNGFVAALIGSLTARLIRPDATWMFGIAAEPTSVLFTGLLIKAKWRPVLLAYGAILAAYFSNPLGRTLPVWTISDVLIAVLLIYPIAKLSKCMFTINAKKLSPFLVLASFFCVATDSLIRIFMLIPCGLYSLISINADALYGIFVGAAAESFFEDFVAVAVSFLVCVPLVITLFKLGLLREKKN